MQCQDHTGDKPPTGPRSRSRYTNWCFTLQIVLLCSLNLRWYL